MAVEDGKWIMRGLAWDDPWRIRSWQELVNWINEIGFLPLFANDVEGFSVEEHVSADFWWTGDRAQDPWEWREIIAASHEVAYGKFFDKKAGFISLDWLAYFANSRRDGYDFDARWEDGLANRREKKIMDILTDHDEDGDILWHAPMHPEGMIDRNREEGDEKKQPSDSSAGAEESDRILSTELKKKAGFGKKGEKNFPGIITGLQMQIYLVITDFHRRTNKKGLEYGMPVSVLLPPETVWGYERVTSAYSEKPADSWQRIYDHMLEMYPNADSKSVIRLIGKKPVE